MSVPFIIYGLPRSRTKWLSTLLTYGDIECIHEASIFVHSIEEMLHLFHSDNVGFSDTAFSYGHALIRHFVPNVREVVIFRPVEEVMASIKKIDVSDVAIYDFALLERNMRYGERCLYKIAQKPDVLVVNYKDLDNEEVCKEIFEHCLPEVFDRSHWLNLKDRNVQVNFKAVLSYYLANREKIDKFKRDCKVELRNLAKAGLLKTETKQRFYA